MSYQVKYKLTFTNLFGETCVLDIEQRDGKLGTSSLKAQHRPILVTWDTPSDDILAPVNGSRAVANIVTEQDFEFRVFYTTDAREWRISSYVDSVLAWQGFVQPRQSMYEYRQAPNTYTLVATDQLGALKAIPWDREGVETEFDSLTAILNQTGLTFGLYESINIYEELHNKTAADTPLTQVYYETEVFEGKSYYEALQQLLFKYAAVIKQEDGNWVITRPEDCNEAYIRRYYTYNDSTSELDYDSNEEHNPIVLTTEANVDTSELVRISDEGPKARTGSAWGRYKLLFTYGLIENALDNGDFEEWTDGDPDDWVKGLEAGAPITGTWSQKNDALRLYADETSGYTSWFSQEINTPHALLQFEMNWSTYVYPDKTLSWAIRLIHDYDPDDPNSNKDYWDFENEEWAFNNPTKNRIYTFNQTGDDAHISDDSLSFVTKAPSYASGQQLKLELYFPIGHNYSYVTIRDVRITILKGVSGNDVVQYDEEYEDNIVLNPNNTYEGPDQELLLHDLGGYAKKVYRGGMWRDSDLSSATSWWQGIGLLSTLLKESISWAHIQPKEILSVSIYSTLIRATSVIQEVNNSDRLYLIKKATWDIKYCKWKIEGYYIGTGDSVGLLTESGEAILAEDGTPLLGEL